MKTIAAVVLLIVASLYGAGHLFLTKERSLRFLDEMEHLSLHGGLDEYCARLHPDLAVSILDGTGDPPAEFSGGARDFCDYVTYATRGVPALGLTTTASRADVSLSRDWLHPWTVR